MQGVLWPTRLRGTAKKWWREGVQASSKATGGGWRSQESSDRNDLCHHTRTFDMSRQSHKVDIFPWGGSISGALSSTETLAPPICPICFWMSHTIETRFHTPCTILIHKSKIMSLGIFTTDWLFHTFTCKLHTVCWYTTSFLHVWIIIPTCIN